jgi:hypothetical protein
MSDITITPTTQRLLLLLVLVLVGAAGAAQIPELRRYLRVRGMD